MINTDTISTIIFDLDGTLCHYRLTYEEELLRIAQLYGHQKNEDTLKNGYRWAHYYWAQSDDLIADHDEFTEFPELIKERYLKRILKAMGVSAELITPITTDMIKILEDGFESEKYIPDDIIPTLKTLRSVGYRVGLLTNRRRPIDEYLESVGFKDLLDFYFYAGEINAWKPDPIVFKYTLDKIKVEPEEVLYVGDNPYADVEGSKNAGMNPVLIDPRGLFPDIDSPIIMNISDLLPLMKL